MLGRDHRADVLGQVPLFAGCAKKDLRRIAAIADEVDLRAGKVLTRQGGTGREFFVLLEGSAEIVQNGKRVATASAGDFFGEMALISNQPRNATVTTTTPVRALVITETNFRRLLRENAGISLKVLDAVACRKPPAHTD